MDAVLMVVYRKARAAVTMPQLRTDTVPLKSIGYRQTRVIPRGISNR